MKMVSPIKDDIKLNFFDLIDYRLSSDFLFGMFLSVFRRKKWDQNLHVIDKCKVNIDKCKDNISNAERDIKEMDEKSEIKLKISKGNHSTTANRKDQISKYKPYIFSVRSYN